MIQKTSNDQLLLPLNEFLNDTLCCRRQSRHNKVNVRVRIDRMADTLRIRFSDDPVSETAEVRPGVMFDYAADGRIVAFEILDASRTVAADDLKKLAVEVA